MSEPSIFHALAAVMADVDHVAKRDQNTHQHFWFRGIDAVVNAVGPALRRHRVIVVPRVLSEAYEVVQTTTGKPATACRVRVAYVFHGPAGDNVETSVIGEAWDSGDKAAPKAMSVAFRTALLQALALPTDDPDPDSETFERQPLDLKQQVWAASKRRDPQLSDGDRRAWIRGELAVAAGATEEAKMRALLQEWS